MREINKAGINLIREFEGERFKPYKDSAGLLTIGIGHLIRQGEHFTSITHAQSESLLQNDLQKARIAVCAKCHVSLTDNQFAACVSFTFNCGAGALSSSTLLRKLNAGDYGHALFDESNDLCGYTGACGEFLKWNKSGGRVTKGLVRRRAAEAALFNQQ